MVGHDGVSGDVSVCAFCFFVARLMCAPYP